MTVNPFCCFSVCIPLQITGFTLTLFEKSQKEFWSDLIKINLNTFKQLHIDNNVSKLKISESKLQICLSEETLY